jgi:hypothetical protein
VEGCTERIKNYIYVRLCHTFPLLCYCVIAFGLNVTKLNLSTKLYDLGDVHCAYVTGSSVTVISLQMFRLRLMDVLEQGCNKMKFISPLEPNFLIRTEQTLIPMCRMSTLSLPPHLHIPSTQRNYRLSALQTLTYVHKMIIGSNGNTSCIYTT